MENRKGCLQLIKAGNRNREMQNEQDLEWAPEPYLQVFLQPDGNVKLLAHGKAPTPLLRKAWAKSLLSVARRLPEEDPRAIARGV